MYNVVAYQVGSSIHIKSCKQKFALQLLFQDGYELYYAFSKDKFVYIFHYGIVCFFNMTDDDIETILNEIHPFCEGYISEKNSEKIEVIVESSILKVQFDTIILPELNEEMLRLVMLNTSHSVALNGYAGITEDLLSETNKHTLYLEEKGRLDISGNKLKRFIGKVLNIKNKISENLYIFDSPEITWENEQLNKLNQDLKIVFDLKDRYRLIQDRIDIIKENLELFKDIMDHKESSRLEWIIIILIVIEVIDLFMSKVANLI
jgi:uncharacterized Rmd1/YagE family protein